MITQRVSPRAARALRHGSVVAGTALWFVMSGSAAAHADVTLPGDTGPVTAVADPVLQPVVEADHPVAQDPVVQAVEPAVPQPVKETVGPAVQQPVKQVVRAAEQVVAPVVRVVEPAVEEVAQAVQPVAQATSVTTSSQEPVAAGANSSHAAAASGQSGAPRDSAPAKSPAGDQGPALTVDGTHFVDLPSRAMGGPTLPTHDRFGADRDSDRSREDLEGITSELMHLYAGDDVPVGIGSGLSGVLPEERRLWLALLVLGMLLGVVAIERARRGSDHPVG